MSFVRILYVFLLVIAVAVGEASGKPSPAAAKLSLNKNGKPAFSKQRATPDLKQASAAAASTSTTSGNGDGSTTAPPPPPSSAQSQEAEQPRLTETLQFKRRPAVDYGLRYSSNDWLITFISTPTSFILRRIKFHLFTQALVALAVIYFYPTNPNLAIPMTGHSLLAASLGLLLSYRTNSAYSRFWEARGYWTKAKATCRNLALMVKAHHMSHSPIAATHFLQLLAAYPGALMYLCLGGSIKMPDYTQQFLPIAKTEEYQMHPARPAMDLCFQMHQTIHAMVFESKTARALDLVEAAHLNEVSHLTDTLLEMTSNCEKILRTPVPWTYSRHTSRFLTLWTLTLPFALIGSLNPWLTFGVTMAASYCM